MTDMFNYKRRAATVAHVGRLNIGGDNPVRVQSMTTTSTLDTEGSVAQCKRIIDAGGELVRLTTQGRREAENLANISRQLRAEGYTQPLCADIHFNANVADVAACHTEKVRINPGNYVDPARTFKHLGIYGRAIRTGTGKDRGTTDDVYRPLQGAPYGGTHWREPRKPLRSHHVALRRHARRYRGELHGVSSHLPQAQLRRRGHLHQGVQHGCHGAVSTPAGSGDGSRGHALPTPSRCNRGG